MTLRWTAEQYADYMRTKVRLAGGRPRASKAVPGPFPYEPAKVVAGVLSVALPLRLVNGANSREHWHERGRRAKAHRELVVQAIPRAVRPSLPVVVTITRIGRKLLDSDNLAISAKHCRDGVQDVYGVDDGDERFTWEYRQELGESFGVRLEIKPR